MNRSLQATLALLVSLTGAMLAITWAPTDGPRPISDPSVARRRSAMPCGFVTSANAAATPPTPARRDSQPSSGGGSTILPSIFSVAPLAEWREAIAQAPVARKLGAAFRALSSPWPPEALESPDQAERELDRLRAATEAEYAAAQRAAAGVPLRSLVAPAWNAVATSLRRSVMALDSRELCMMADDAADQIGTTYQDYLCETGWDAVVERLTIHARRHKERLALREALLRELDRNFLEIFERPDSPLPDKPRFQRPNRKVFMAASDALKSLSRLLDTAADRLEAASREDVAELHTPVENGEEKR